MPRIFKNYQYPQFPEMLTQISMWEWGPLSEGIADSLLTSHILYELKPIIMNFLLMVL